MGVHGLWQLLAPVGRRVSNDYVHNKVLAVDISIWLTQLVKAMRDAEGARVRNAHLIGVFRRCIKLLFLSVKPILVFDGATPAIKRRTVASRRAQREKHEAKLRRLAEKILINRMKKKAVGDAISRKNGRNLAKSSESIPALGNGPLTQGILKNVGGTSKSIIESDALEDEADEIQPVYQNPSPSNTPRKKFGVSATRNNHVFNEANAPKLAKVVDDTEDFTQNSESENEQIILPSDLQDLDDATLVGLPTHMQSKVFRQIKQEQRLRHRENMLQQQDNPTEFSRTQIDGFLRHTALNRKISNVRNVINNNSGVRNRIASDSRREFVFEELHETEQDVVDSDSEDDILRSSYLTKDSDVRPKDILSQIRAAQGDSLDTSLQMSSKVEEKRHTEKQLSSGVGWASRVLSGRGGLELSRITTGGMGCGPNFRSTSEKRDREEDEEVGVFKQNDMPSPSDSVQKQWDPLPEGDNDSDSDDVEWEDGAGKSDSENSGRTFELEEISEGTARKVSVSDEKGSLITSVIEKKGALSTATDSVRKKQITDAFYARPDSSPVDGHNSGGLNSRGPQEIRERQQGSVTDIDKSVAAADIDFDEDIRTVGKVDFPGRKTKHGIPPNSPPLPFTNEKTSQRRKRDPAKSAGQLSRNQIGSADPSKSVLRSSSVRQQIATASQKNSFESDDTTSPSTKTIPHGVCIQRNEDATDETNARKSRTVQEEENDIQLAIALSLKQNTSDILKSSTSDKLSHLEVEAKRKRKTVEQPKKLTILVDEKYGTTRNAPDETDKRLEETQIDLSFKSPDAIGFTSPENLRTVEKERGGQKPEGEMTLMEMERLYADLDSEAQLFRKQRDTHVGAVETISDEMYSETRDLLKLLGIPYLEAPMEAEAQCAFLNTAKIVDGVITEDSDAFLFGAKVVYRQLFADGRFAETYDTQDIKSSLGLDRDLLIRLAHLLGSDYTPGVRGVGIVNAMEIMEAFPGVKGLSEFLEWTKKVTVLDKEPEESVMKGTSTDAVRRRFCWKHRNMKRNWVVREGFPNPAVSEAYLNPIVDSNKDRFKWREINFDGLARFCWEKFGWERTTFENAVGPLRKELLKRKGLQQTRISDFYKPHRFAKIRSKRLQNAVKGMAGEDAEEIMATLVPRIKRRKTSSMTYTSTMDLSPEEEGQMLKMLEEAEAKTNGEEREDVEITHRAD
ncbi:unnamed protein product [Agarophyton chilense]|eukprot:gb/GEZJ01001932.1/.p1 GENE.gb/GEZJ01001932.1/~~gb/GEZJ01001932.1/.p1  ORF type:complete len:1189 (-),score=214.49 gb/GEZJ01001932.1/:10214-13780(-)